MKVLSSRQECLKCHTIYEGNFCGKCFYAFFFRDDAEDMNGEESAKDIVEWAKAAIPASFIRKRASELMGRNVSQRDISTNMPRLVAQLRSRP